ncbi:hypothetical protein C2S51_021316 [Perilla frutescens var. frutescens]|nr:hypothetical protein C2S51_021316 [Perilla frutescens var. frutescens]
MASKMTIPVACTLVVLFAGYGTEAIVGMNWGRESAQRLLPSQVVDLLLQNGIGNARVYTAQKDILAAFSGSGINLTVSIFNTLAINSIQAARAWVLERHEFFIPTTIRSIYLGGYVFDKAHDKAYISSSLQALRWMQSALNERQLGQQVKANFVHCGSAMKPNKTKPSEGEFLDEFKEEMLEYVQFLQENDAPFVIQLFPAMEAIETESFDDISFAFPDGKSNTIVKDINGLVYTNVVEWQIDRFVWALSKLNASNLKIVVGQIGWPTDGYLHGNATNAERFWKHLLPWVTSNKGTPLRPGEPIDIFAHALTDETKMGFPLGRHWGIYRSNGEPKYKIDLSGQDRDIYPITVKGIMHMPRRWCLFNGDHRDLGKVKRLFDWTCSRTDCSSLNPGGSCSSLSFEQNVSFAFNLYFQYQFQDESACDFEGLAGLSVEDPSTEDCVFPVEVVKGQQNNYVALSANYGWRPRPNHALFAFWVWISALTIFFM